jgi:cell division protease FtsH
VSRGECPGETAASSARHIRFEALYEARHALEALSVKHADPAHRVSIIPRSTGALGHTLQLPTEEKLLMTMPELEDQLAVTLGGRAVEEIIYEGVVSL